VVGEARFERRTIDPGLAAAHEHFSMRNDDHGTHLTYRATEPTASSAPRLSLPAASAILDGELVAIGEDGMPDFGALHRGRRHNLRLYVFDLLHLDGIDFGQDPLTNRKALLKAQLGLHRHPSVRLVEAFEDGDRLLAEAESMGLEGVVSKRRDAPYRSGPRCGWVKVKTAAWRAANADRGQLFSRERDGG